MVRLEVLSEFVDVETAVLDESEGGDELSVNGDEVGVTDTDDVELKLDPIQRERHDSIPDKKA